MTLPSSIVLTGLLALATGCGWSETRDFLTGRARLERSHEAHSRANAMVRVDAIELAPSPDGGVDAAELRLTLRNTLGEPLWVRVLVGAPRADQGCEDVYPLEPMGSALAVCPQEFGLGDSPGTFTVEITAYDDIGQTKVAERARLRATIAPDGATDVVWE